MRNERAVLFLKFYLEVFCEFIVSITRHNRILSFSLSLSLSLSRVEHHRLALKVGLQARLAELAANPGSLEASERQRRVKGVVAIDPDGARAQAPGDGPRCSGGS